MPAASLSSSRAGWTTLFSTSVIITAAAAAFGVAILFRQKLLLSLLRGYKLDGHELAGVRKHTEDASLTKEKHGQQGRKSRSSKLLEKVKAARKIGDAVEKNEAGASAYPDVGQGLQGCIGNTPLIRIRSLSEATGCQILAKAEFLNPGGSVKDRVALQIIVEALETGELQQGGLVTEGSAGSTGISLAMVAAAFGCRCFVALPDDAAEEKAEMLEALGAEVQRVRPVSITHPDHFVNVARRRAGEERAALLARKAKEGDISAPSGQQKPVPETRTQGAQANLGEWNSSQPAANGDPPDEAGVRHKASGSTADAAKSSPLMADDKDAVFGEGPSEAPLEVPPVAGFAQPMADSSSQHGSLISVIQLEEGSQARKEGSPLAAAAAGERKPRGGFFANQFENLANFRAHYWGTGREIWEQTGGKVDAFVAAAGTGGTVAGVSRYLKDRNPDVKCFLIDPPGSSLYNRVTRGVLYAREEAEGRRLRNPFDTITEGIGINRLTTNFLEAQLDGAFRGTDREAVEMARYLLLNDGLFLGSSAAMNCVGAMRVARSLGPGHTIVTIFCDSGQRHLSKFYNPAYLASQSLTPTATGLEFLK